MSERVPIELEVNREAVAKIYRTATVAGGFPERGVESPARIRVARWGRAGAFLVLLNGKSVHSCMMFAGASRWRPGRNR